jgi:hypothetical protein
MADKRVRNRGQYDARAAGGNFSNMPPDDVTINTAVAQVNLMRPREDKAMVFRIMPAASTDGSGSVLPGRLTADTTGSGLSDFYIIANAVKYFGIPKDQGGEQFTMLLENPQLLAADSTLRNRELYRTLLSNARNAHDGKGKFAAATGHGWRSDWNRLLPQKKDADTKSGPLPNPSSFAYVPALIYCDGRVDYISGKRSTPLGAEKRDLLTLVQMSGYGFNRYLSLFDIEKENIDPGLNRHEHPAGVFLYGDPIGTLMSDGSVKGGYMSYAFRQNKVFVKDELTASKKKISVIRGNGVPGLPLSQSTWDGKKSAIAPYEVGFNRVYRPDAQTAIAADLTAEQAAMCFDKYQYFLDQTDAETGKTLPGLLRFMSDEEKMLYIARAFASVPGFLRFCLADRSDLLESEAVSAVLNKRRSVVNPRDLDAVVGEGEGEPADDGRPQRTTTVDRSVRQTLPPVEDLADDTAAGDPVGDDPDAEVAETEGEQLAEEPVGDDAELAAAAAAELESTVETETVTEEPLEATAEEALADEPSPEVEAAIEEDIPTAGEPAVEVGDAAFADELPDLPTRTPAPLGKVTLAASKPDLAAAKVALETAKVALNAAKASSKPASTVSTKPPAAVGAARTAAQQAATAALAKSGPRTKPSPTPPTRTVVKK